MVWSSTTRTLEARTSSREARSTRTYALSAAGNVKRCQPVRSVAVSSTLMRGSLSVTV